MKAVLLLLSVLITTCTQAQVWVQGKDINQQVDLVYVTVSLRTTLGIGFYKGCIDFGQRDNTVNAIRSRIQQWNADTNVFEEKEFNSPMAVFAFLEKNGWEYVDVFTQAGAAESYLFRRKKGSE